MTKRKPRRMHLDRALAAEAALLDARSKLALAAENEAGLNELLAQERERVCNALLAQLTGGASSQIDEAAVRHMITVLRDGK